MAGSVTGTGSSVSYAGDVPLPPKRPEEFKRLNQYTSENNSSTSGKRDDVHETDKDKDRDSRVQANAKGRKVRSDKQKNKVFVNIPPGAKNKKEYLEAAAKDASNKSNAPAEAKEAPRDTQPSSGGGGGGGGQASNTLPPSWLGTQPPQIPPTGTNPSQPTQPVPEASRLNSQRLRELGKLINVPGNNIGGYVHPGTFAIANEIVDRNLGVDYFNSWNHGKHNPGSKHYQGLAVDMQPIDRSNLGYARLANNINKLLNDNGIAGKVYDENARCTGACSGAHVHVEFLNRSEAERAAQVFGRGQSGVPGGTQGGTNQDNGTNNGNNGPFNPAAVPAGAVTMADRVALAKAAGFTPDQAVVMGAISQAESSGNSNSYNGVGRDNSYGLWQINMIGSLGTERDALFKKLIPGYTNRNDLFDPWKNAQAAKIIYNQQGPSAWSTYSSGAYRPYLNNAANGIGAGSSTAGINYNTGATWAGGAYRGSAGPGRYPATSQGLRTNTSNGNNPYGGGQPQLATLQLGQWIQQSIGSFDSVQSFTYPPPNIANNAPYRQGLVIDFKIINPTLERSIEATNILIAFLDKQRIGAFVENFYLYADPIENGYIHVELNPDSVGQASYVFNLISNYNAGIIELEDDNSLLPPNTL